MEKRQLHTSRSHKHASFALSPKALLGAIVALLAALLLLMSVISLAQKHRAIRTRIRDLRDEQAKLEAKEERLAETNAYLATEEGAEQTLRAKFNVTRPGEELIIITPRTQSQASTEQESRVSRWWDSILRGLGIRN